MKLGSFITCSIAFIFIGSSRDEAMDIFMRANLEGGNRIKDNDYVLQISYGFVFKNEPRLKNETNMFHRRTSSSIFQTDQDEGLKKLQSFLVSISSN